VASGSRVWLNEVFTENKDLAKEKLTTEEVYITYLRQETMNRQSRNEHTFLEIFILTEIMGLG